MLKPPFELVSEALGCKQDSLSEESGLNVHPMWDSLGHLNVMMALEELYGVQIDNDGIQVHQNMAGILRTYLSLQKETHAHSTDH